MSLSFGDWCIFNAEYVSSKAETLNIQQSIREIEKEIKEKNIELLEEIRTKQVKNIKEKQGIYLRETKINLAVYYDYQDSIDVGIGCIPERYTVEKCNFIDVAEVKVKDIKKTYLVPLNNIRKLDKK